MAYDNQDKGTGNFPDFHEYHEKIKAGEVFVPSEINHPGKIERGPSDFSNSTRATRWIPSDAPKHGKIREGYNPEKGGAILKKIVLRHTTDNSNDPQNTGESGYNGSNRNFPHYGGDNDWGFEGRREPGLYCYYTPVKSDSLIKLEVRFTTYWNASPWCIYVWAFQVDGQKVAHGRKQSQESSHTDNWFGHTNSWGAGVQKLVEFVGNSDNTSYYTGITSPTSAYSEREFIITEYENMNPYGDAVMRWRYDNIHF